MLGLAAPGSRVWLSEIAPTRSASSPYAWELVEVDLGGGLELVGVNTGHPNPLVAEAIAAGAIPEFAGYPIARREVKYGRNSRVDFLLEAPGRPPCYVEVKNVHLMRRPGLAEFPDCVTARGAKHLAELSDMVRGGTPRRDAVPDPDRLGDALRARRATSIRPMGRPSTGRGPRGVEAIAYTCGVTTEGIVVAGRVADRR